MMTWLAGALVKTQREVLPTEEVGWVLAARRGDSQAVLRLLERHRPPLVRLLAGLLGDHAAAEDAAQEAFLVAFRSLGQLKDPAAFYPWVRKSAVRVALRARPSHPAPGLDQVPETEAGANPITGLETRLAIEAVLARLPADLRAVLVLREIEGLDYAEMAGVLGVPVGTVRSRLFTARERFRAHWREMEEE